MGFMEKMALWKTRQCCEVWMKIWIFRCLSSWKSPAQLCKIAELSRLHEYDITLFHIKCIDLSEEPLPPYLTLFCPAEDGCRRSLWGASRFLWG